MLPNYRLLGVRTIDPRVIPLIIGGLVCQISQAKLLPTPANTPVPAATKIARPNGAAVLAPNGNFQTPALASGFKSYASLTAPEKTALVWVMTGSAGISANGSGFTNQNPPVTAPTQVAYLQNTASMSVTHNFASAGSWRVRYFAAQRVQGGVLNEQQIRIRVGGVEVDAETPQDPKNPPALGTYTEYASRPFEVTAGNQSLEFFTATATDETALIYNIRLEKVRKWNLASNWFLADGTTIASAAPTTTDHVMIGEGNAIVIDDANCVASTVTVYKGELLALEVPNITTTLKAKAVMIMGVGGTFEVGKPEFPFKQKFSLTLRGGVGGNEADTTGENYMGGGTNVLMAMGGGLIDMHGINRRSWTKLSNNTSTTSNTINLADPVTWEDGDQFVITGSKISSTEFDVMTIADMPNSTTITATGNPGFPHFGFQKTYNHGATNIDPSGSTTIDERAEVGLLTRNVKIQGDNGTVADGGHVMIMKMTSGSCTLCDNNGGGFARIANVEFLNMGQKRRLGRYPFHWHMLGAEGSGQYLKNCSIRDSRNRVLSIHGTNNTLVDNNVAYNHIGHGVLLEDGSEQNNTITRNLIMGTKMAALLPGQPVTADIKNYNLNEAVLPTDNSHSESQNKSPAAFWITNPNNTIDNNVAAGTEGTGFWFALDERPVGLSYTLYPNLKPRRLPLLSFQGNKAHGCGTGFDINDGVDVDEANPTDVTKHTLNKNFGYLPTTVATISGFKAYSNRRAIYTGIAEGARNKLVFDQAVVSDNLTQLQQADYSRVTNSLLVADTGSGVLAPADLRVAYDFYDGAGGVKDSHFIGYDSSTRILLGPGGAAVLHTNAEFNNLVFWKKDFVAGQLAQAKPYIDFPNYDTGLQAATAATWGVVARDTTGDIASWQGLTGDTTRSVITNHRLLRTNSDVVWTNGTASKAYLSNKKFGHLRMEYLGVPRLPNGDADIPDVTYTRTGGGAGEMQPTSVTDQGKLFPWTQMPVIVRAAAPYNQPMFTYECNFLSAFATTTPATKLIINFEDLNPGDISPMLILTGAGIPTGGISAVETSVNNGARSTLAIKPLADLQVNALVASGYHKDVANDKLYIRVKNPLPGTANSVEVFLKW
jgi:cell surface hyaluronidase